MMMRKILFYIIEIAICYLSLMFMSFHSVVWRSKTYDFFELFTIIALYIALFVVSYHVRYKHFKCVELSRNDKFYLWAFLCGIYLIFATLFIAPLSYDPFALFVIAIFVMWKTDFFEVLLCGNEYQIIQKKKLIEEEKRKKDTLPSNIQNELKQCTNCGKPIDKDSQFCTYCGSPVE